MAKNPHTEDIGKESAVRAGECVIYQGRKLDLRKLVFTIHCWESGVSPWNGTPLTSNKGSVS